MANIIQPFTAVSPSKLFSGWEIMDCLEFGSAEASMMVRANNCSDALPGTEEVREFIRQEKEQYGEMIARA